MSIQAVIDEGLLPLRMPASWPVESELAMLVATYAKGGGKTARLLVKTLTGVNLIPQAAIQRNNDVAFVYVKQADSSVQSKNIKITATEGETSAVTGVNPGDQLVTDGFDKLNNGSKIVERKPAAAEAAEAKKPG